MDESVPQGPAGRAYAKEVGARLRRARMEQGLSLMRVEEKSAGTWKAVVVGSYERADRAITVMRLAELARFYGVPITDLLPGQEAAALRPRQLLRRALALLDAEDAQ